MNLTEELKWRGLLHQTTYQDVSVLDNKKVTFYWGVDPSADSMTVGNLAAAMLAKHLIKHGHKAILLVGGATGLIGDPDGKMQERDLISKEEIDANKQKIADQYKQIFKGDDFEIVDNYDWFKDIKFLEFLRDTGKHIPLRQMQNRDFVQARTGEGAAGISYAEFSYVLIQAYDFYYLNENRGVELQICGSDQWGNSIAGVDLTRRKSGKETHVLSIPLVIDKSTGRKFGKTEGGAVWLDSKKTTPTAFYQFWINTDDHSASEFLKIYTELEQPQIAEIMEKHESDPSQRVAQKALAREVTKLVHGEQHADLAEKVTSYLTGASHVGEASEGEVSALKGEIPTVSQASNGSIIEALVESGLASSNTEARRLIESNAIAVNGQKVLRDNFEPGDFSNGRALIRRGKAYKDSALVLSS